MVSVPIVGIVHRIGSFFALRDRLFRLGRV